MLSNYNNNTVLFKFYLLPLFIYNYSITKKC